MSMNQALQAISRMNMQPALIAGFKISDMASSMNQLSRSEYDDEVARTERAEVEMLSNYGFSRSEDRKPFAYSNGLAIIPIHGSLINRFGASWGFVTGYNFIRAQMDAANADPDVKGIVFDISSHGGEVSGCFELSEDIKASAKPTLAMVDSSAYSAGYALASAADRIVTTPSSGVGSIGVVAVHMSIERLLENQGVEVSMIYAGSHKVDGNPYEKLPDEVRADIQAGVSKTREKFVALVATNRGMDAQVIMDTEAKTYRAEEALAAGLIDAIEKPETAAITFLNELCSDLTEDESMTNLQATAPGVTQPVAATAPQMSADDIRKEERARVAGITSCAEAADRPALANYFATQTGMSLVEAQAALKVAAPEKASAPTPTPAAPSPFHAAMGASAGPNVGADAEGATSANGTVEVSDADFILGAMAIANGTKGK